MRRIFVAPVSAAFLAAASLACFALPSVNSLPIFKVKPAAPTQQKPPASQQADLPITVYDPDISDDIAAGLPEVVMAYGTEPDRPGMPETAYGSQTWAQVIEISAAPAGTAKLPSTIYDGQQFLSAPSAEMPQTVAGGGTGTEPAEIGRAAATETIAGAGPMAQSPGGPETVYSYNATPYPVERRPGNRGPVNEAVAQAAIAADSIAANPNGDEVETAPGQAAPASAGPSPYTHYTDAQRVGVNPCEVKNHQASPYTNLTDAQRAGQTNCY